MTKIKPFKFVLKSQKILLEKIIQRKARHRDYIQHIPKYSKIMKYIVDGHPKHSNIPLRYLEPFILAHVSECIQ